jgi:hypothetical protein
MVKLDGIVAMVDQLQKKVAELTIAQGNTVSEKGKLSVTATEFVSKSNSQSHQRKSAEGSSSIMLKEDKVMDNDNEINMALKVSKAENDRFVNNNKKFSDIVKELDNNSWLPASNRRKNKIIPKYGTKGNSECKSLKAAKMKRTWHLYIGNLDRGTTKDDIYDYFKENNVEVFLCEMLREGAWDERPSSFHLEIDYEKKDIVMQESFWSVGVKVRNWTFPRKSKIWN